MNENFKPYEYAFRLPLLESGFDPKPYVRMMQSFWIHSLTLSAIYVILLYTGQRWMRRREKFDLKRPLIWWNVALAIFSFVGAVRTTPEFAYILTTYGFRTSVCNCSYFREPVTAFWVTVFMFSKAVELVDTAFLVLRKRPVSFLHAYHHTSVLVYSWHAYKVYPSAARWFMCMNFNVHAFMYAYYAISAAGYRLPKTLAATITLMQLTQMIAGCAAIVEVYRTKTRGQPCEHPMENVYFAFAIYSTYLLLFLHYFYTSYIKTGSKKQLRLSEKHTENGSTHNGIANGYHAEKKLD